MSPSCKTPKKWYSFEEQLHLLEERGLKVQDKKRALAYLERIGYYRLSAYWYPFKTMGSDKRNNTFLENSSFEEALNLYVFDKRLRLLALDALERIEVALRVDIAYLLGERDIFAHMNRDNFDSRFQYSDWNSKYQKLLHQSRRNEFVIHHTKYYEGKLPIWVASEIWDFGALSRLYAGMKLEDKNKIARKYRLPSGRSLENQCHAFNFIRNTSAHHSRLWNRAIIGRTSLKGLRDPILETLSADQVFLYFCLMKRMLNIISPRSSWGERFKNLLHEFPTSKNRAISLKQFGLPDGIDLSDWELWF